MSKRRNFQYLYFSRFIVRHFPNTSQQVPRTKANWIFSAFVIEPFNYSNTRNILKISQTLQKNLWRFEELLMWNTVIISFKKDTTYLIRSPWIVLGLLTYKNYQKIVLKDHEESTLTRNFQTFRKFLCQIKANCYQKPAFIPSKSLMTNAFNCCSSVSEFWYMKTFRILKNLRWKIKKIKKIQDFWTILGSIWQFLLTKQNESLFIRCWII